jgi:tetratricopeptide (TPR) repeat protein
MTDAQGPTDGHEVALKAAGLNSAEELNRDLAALDDPNLRESFETAYRRTFSAKIAQRDYPQSLELAQKVIGARPQFAPAYRVLGYAYFNAGQASEALRAYLKAVEINPNYGEAHYALAFMYAMGDVGAGREHFKKALDLGVKDERKLGERFYSDTP